jgi:hypothetical protein
LFQYGKLNMGQNIARGMIHFKGSSSKTTRDIPAQTAEEKQLQDRYQGFANSSMNTADSLINKGYGALNNVANVDFGGMLGNYNNAMTGINQGYSNLANGQLPTEFATARQNALNTDLNSTIGSAVNNLANRGIINSSVTNSVLNGITRNASDTLARNYTSDLGTYGNILNNQQSSMGNAMNTNILGQQASFYPAQQYMNMGYNAAQPLQNLFNTMYSGRMGTAGSTTTQSGGDNGVASGIASIGSALILCFTAGTKIATPKGDINIEDIAVGMKVWSLDEQNNLCTETVQRVIEPCERPVLEVITNKGTVKCTVGQPFITVNGVKNIEDVKEELIMLDGHAKVLEINELPPEMVYDFTTTGRDVFFANKFAVEGYD